MTYTKPEINHLGDAASVIQILTKPAGLSFDGQRQNVQPAYDLDE